MSAFSSNEHYTDLFKKGAGAYSEFSSMAFENFEKLNDLNIKYLKSSMKEASEKASEGLELKDIPETVSFWQAMAEPMSAKVATYYKEIYKINSGFVKAAASLIEAETEEVGKTVSEKVSEFSKSAPAGSEGVVAMTKSSIAASTSTYESMTKAAKQVLEIVDSNVEAATKAGQAAVSPVSKGKAKKAA